MELGKNWGAVDPTRSESFQGLGEREQNTIRVALAGISSWQRTRQEPKPMHIRVADGRPFNLRSFAQVLHELGIGFTDALRQEEDGSFILQPRPYSRTFMPITRDDRFNALRETLEEEIQKFSRKWYDGHG